MPGKDSAFIVEHAFEKLDPNFPAQAKALRESGKTIILVAGKDFGINSSREQAAQILRDIGVAVIVAPSFARAFLEMRSITGSHSSQPQPRGSAQGSSSALILEAAGSRLTISLFARALGSRMFCWTLFLRADF